MDFVEYDDNLICDDSPNSLLEHNLIVGYYDPEIIECSIKEEIDQLNQNFKDETFYEYNVTQFQENNGGNQKERLDHSGILRQKDHKVQFRGRKSLYPRVKLMRKKRMEPRVKLRRKKRLKPRVKLRRKKRLKPRVKLRKKKTLKPSLNL